MVILQFTDKLKGTSDCRVQVDVCGYNTCLLACPEISMPHKYADGLVSLSKFPSKSAFLYFCRQTVKMIHFARRRMLKKTTQRPGRQLSCKSLAVTGWESALMIFFLCPQRASPCFVKTLTHSAPTASK